MRLTFSQYLARLPDCATNMFWGGCSAGRYLPDSWRIVSCFVALRAASVGPENETRPLGVKGGTWVESEANGWREMESEASRQRRAARW